jgi:hypothetical protein
MSEENILLKIHQHKISLIFQIVKLFVICWTPVFIVWFIIKPIYWLLALIITFIIISIYEYYLWSKSYLIITNKKISLEVRNRIFSKYNLLAYFGQIRDFAYSRNNVFHYMFNYWTLFIRTSAAGDGSVEITRVPNIEKIYEKVNYIYNLWEFWRENLENISEKEKSKTTSKEDLTEKVKSELLAIKWIKEAILLDDKDKQFIFKTEEDRNHGVYEALKRDISFAVTHNSSFRDADAPIVLKLWNKVIFPPVSFHEIKEKNTVSSSPWIEVHKYLSAKFSDLASDDATLIIGFDI